MTFIGPDERIVILDYNMYDHAELNADELVRLRNVGIKTVACYADWHGLETKDGYDWSSLDTIINRYLKAGLKAIVKVYMHAPQFFPDDWYLRARDGDIQRHIGPRDPSSDSMSSSLSYWNPKAWAHHLDFVWQCCEHFSASDILCINIAPANGEALIPGNNYLFDKHALASYLDFTHAAGELMPGEATPGTPTLDWLRATVIPAQVETQRIFHKYGGEYWTMLHHAFETIPSTGNWLIDDLYTALHKELGDEHWGICYTVFREGETRGLWGPEQDIKRHGIKMLFASEGPIGLFANTKRAIDMGARGMLTGPLAPYMGHARMDDWMYAAIRTTSGWWEGK